MAFLLPEPSCCNLLQFKLICNSKIEIYCNCLILLFSLKKMLYEFLSISVLFKPTLSSLHLDSNCNCASCLLPQFQVNSNLESKQEFKRNSQFNCEQCTTLQHRQSWHCLRPPLRQSASAALQTQPRVTLLAVQLGFSSKAPLGRLR